MGYFERRFYCVIALLVLALGASCQAPMTGAGDISSAGGGTDSMLRFNQMVSTDRSYTIAGMTVRHPYSLYMSQPPENYWVFGVLPKGTMLQITETRPKGDIQSVGETYYVATVKTGKFKNWRFEVFESDVKRWESS